MKIKKTGTTVNNLRSKAVTINSGTWYHAAATYNYGSVTFYLDGVAVGSGSVSGSTVASLYNTTAALKFGATDSAQSTSTFVGTIDEARLSQMLRYVGSFTKPSAAFSAD